MSTPNGEKVSIAFSERIGELIGSGTVTGFARQTGLKQAAIDRYVKGQREPNADALRKIAMSCGVTTDWLLGLSKYPNGVNGEGLVAPPTASRDIERLRADAAQVCIRADSFTAAIDNLKETLQRFSTQK